MASTASRTSLDQHRTTVLWGRIWVGTLSGTLFALTAAGVDSRIEHAWSTTPVVGDFGYGADGAYVGSGASVVALSAAGNIRWESGVGEPIHAAPAAVDGTVYAATRDGTLVALSAVAGDERWRVETGGAIHGAPAIGGDHAYVGSRDRRLYAVAVEDGSVAWRIELPDWVDGSPAVGYGALFVVDQSGTLSAVHAKK
ncbi:MAG: PQQ-binding-like beta-propeller repeat protein [Halolamina sp.]|uniref:PQQ-binding-like beta-propeller repeat protein n=1 Tax=Halolamina sp. TaxID=1940283 RepID=UPI002FC37D03